MELVVNMAIIGIIMVIVTSLMSTSLRSFNRQNDRLNAVNVGDIVISTIRTQIEKVGHIKMNKYFVEEPILDANNVILDYCDQTGDNKPDRNICDVNSNQYPICLHDIQNYTTIFLMPSKPAKTNEERRKFTGADRRGKLYKIKKDVNAKTPYITVDTEVGFGVQGYTVDGYNKPIYIEPLLDESMYRGYEVDVRFEYIISNTGQGDENADTGQSASSILKTTGAEPTNPIPTEPNANGGNAGQGGDSNGGTVHPVLPDIKPDAGPGGRLNCIKITVDVYNGIKKVHTTSGTITFIQKYFTMDTPYEGYQNVYDMVLIRS